MIAAMTARATALTRKTIKRTRSLVALVLPVLALGGAARLHAQGTLTVTPGPAAITTGGTGLAGYTGDAAAATSATFASPGALAYDAAGNLYIADRDNHVIRMISPQGTVTTVAGSGQQGFAGDGGPATAAMLDSPSGVAIDAAGNLYIADSHNHAIREVTAGTIATIAGTGTAGFAGDGGPALSAALSLPTSVAVDAAGSLYIADTGNHRIRLVTSGIISTFAGTGEELFAGDGGPATAAALDTPTGVAVDSLGRLYIADRHNHRIRVIDNTGTISTLAGSVSGFSGGFAGDGADPSAAALSKPTGVSVDASGNVYIADTGNQRIRQVSSGSIATVFGSGDQGFGGDAGAATAALLNAPRAAVADASGNLVVADTLNQRLRAATLPSLAFTSASVGSASLPQTITFANSGTAALTLSNLAFTGAFSAAAGGSCPTLPLSLAAGASCTQNIAFLPATAGAASGSVSVSGPGIVPHTILLTGSSAMASSTAVLAAGSAAVFTGQPVTLTLSVTPSAALAATGTGTFYDGTTLLGTMPLANDAATLMVTTLAAGTHALTAVYSGDTNTAGSSAAPITEIVTNADFTIVPDPASPAGSTNQTVAPGQPATYALMVQPLSGPLSVPITLSATGLPPGSSVTFTPPTLNVGAVAASFTMTIHTATAHAALERWYLPGGPSRWAISLLLLPFAGTLRRRGKYLRGCAMIALLLIGGTALTTLSGCGTNSGFFGQTQKTYVIQVIGTADGPGGATLQHLTTVQLTLQ